MNIVLLLAHAVEEYDQVRLLSELGYNVFSIGAYSEPAKPSVDIRPAIPNAPDYPELRSACHARREERADRKDILTPDGLRPPVDWAKADLPDAVFDWADTIICHHFEHTWIVPQWHRIKEKRVIWRTVGQSVEYNERMMQPLRREGIQIVRYSPNEVCIPGYAGDDALIRFYKDPAEWSDWNGTIPTVINFTQNLRQRDPYTNWRFWEEATRQVSRKPCGPGSEWIEGPGEMSWESMRDELRNNRAYLYTGTQPASYTLGLIEAMMTGIPVVSIGPSWMNVFPYGPLLFEGHQITEHWSNSPMHIEAILKQLLKNPTLATAWSISQRERAIDLFGKDKVARQWKEFLG